jgi:hypothetical protein
MTSAPAGATDQNTCRLSNSTPCRWRSSRYSSRNVRVRWCSSWFANVTPESNTLPLTRRECSVTFLPRKTTEAPRSHGPIVRKRTLIRAVHRRGNAWLVVPPSNADARKRHHTASGTPPRVRTIPPMKVCKSPRHADAMTGAFQKPDGNAGRDGSMAGMGFSSAPAGAKRLMYRIPVVCTTG